MRKTNLAQLLRGRAEGIFIAPFEQGEIGPDLFDAACRMIERIGPVFSQLYGQTECYPVSVLRKADHDPKTPEMFLSCGFPIAACEVKILDDQDHEVETGESQEGHDRVRRLQYLSARGRGR